MSDLDYYWKQILKLAVGERTGNKRGLVIRYADYMLLEAEDGAKRTSCLDAARFLAGKFSFEQVEEIS